MLKERDGMLLGEGKLLSSSSSSSSSNSSSSKSSSNINEVLT